ncbi:MAG: lysophospholipid acyltransferase family protein [Rhodobacteraceae bacterium]|nr:lysophospholipid acyltransferase family protein [Paracoccaceae bacterium]
MKEAIKAFLRGPAGTRLISTYLRFVNLTSRRIVEPADPDQRFGHDGPVIYATWHGQNFIFAFRFPKGHMPTLLVAHHGDGRMAGQAMSHLGVPLIHGSGSTEAGIDKGGARAFLGLLKDLRRGQSVTLTADVPKVAREVGEGIVLLARKSGVPIIPVAMTTSRRRTLGTWDRMQWNLPFSKMVFVAGAPMRVPNDSSPLAPYQEELRATLETLQSRAFQIADGE